MGHAGAIVSGGQGRRRGHDAAMEAAGIRVSPVRPRSSDHAVGTAPRSRPKYAGSFGGTHSRGRLSDAPLAKA
jgi:hypothetical protein